MVRILQVVNKMDRAGLETMLMNYYRNIDRTQLQFDFLVHRNEVGAYDGEIKEMGGCIYHAPRLYPNNYIKYFKYMKVFFAEHPEYLIVHSHIDSMSFFPLLAAKKNGVLTRIGHSHSSSLDRDIKLPIKYMSLKLMPTVANVHLSCSDRAGQFMYPDGDYKILRNAIDIEKFEFNEQMRVKIRKKLDVQGKFVLGHVGRFYYVKNQSFLLDVFFEVLKRKADSVLILVGKGEDEQKLRKKANDLGMADKVIFLIDRDDVDEIYQAFDIFVMPSLFEGLPVVGVEAQANGMPCVFSNMISREVLLTNNVCEMEINKSAKEWAEKILSLNVERNLISKDELKEKGYDIKLESKKLQDWYLDTYHNVHKY